jgi:hypothetical protein
VHPSISRYENYPNITTTLQKAKKPEAPHTHTQKKTMISRTILPVLSLAALLTTTTSAFPSRTHCRCTITESNSHFLPESIPTSEYTDTAPFDVCTTLGPELEDFRATKPEQYTHFISQALTATPSEDATSTDGEKPLPTTVLLQLAVRNGLGNLGVVVPRASATRSGQAIVCRTEIHSSSKYQDSLITLVVVQVIVGLAILACVAECITLALRRYVVHTDSYPPSHVLTPDRRLSSSTQEHIPKRPALRLSGEEKRLLAIPVEDISSPGLDKKLRLYRNGDWTPKLAGAKREFEAYVTEEDDDELSRPVM